MPDDATESVATHSLRQQPSIIYMPQLQPCIFRMFVVYIGLKTFYV